MSKDEKKSCEIKTGQTQKSLCTKRNTALLRCAKRAGLYVIMTLVFFYWQQTGQMMPSAALPCMLACSMAVGVHVGKYLREVQHV